MIGVTLFAVTCGYVGWQAKIVRGRTAFRDAHCGFSWVGDDNEVPWLRRCLGDEPYKTLAMPSDSSKDLRDQAASLFPEARIMADHPGFNGSSYQVTSFPDDGNTCEFSELTRRYDRLGAIESRLIRVRPTSMLTENSQFAFRTCILTMAFRLAHREPVTELFVRRWRCSRMWSAHRCRCCDRGGACRVPVPAGSVCGELAV